MGIVRGLKRARNDWRTDPIQALTKIILSFIVGQGVFWVIGYDQWGFFMDTKQELGLGRTVADRVYRRLPHTRRVAWAVKILEIVADAGKMPTEGAAYARHGYVGDGVATIVTQPLWSALETAEKIGGAVVHPERVDVEEQVKTSLGCIYGSLFRYVTAGVIWLFGGAIYRLLGRPIERSLRRLLPAGKRLAA